MTVGGAERGLKRTVTQCVYHVSLSVSPSEKLSSEKWIDIGRTYLDGMEFKENQYAIYRHRDREHDHIHIIASRIRITDGSVVSDSWNYRRSERLVRQLIGLIGGRSPSLRLYN
ncbi:MAG: relaxase/mobilization nuclease domain-containing protein [Xenococcaceae cyanobacterium]